MVDLEFDTRECRHYSSTLYQGELTCDSCGGRVESALNKSTE